MKSLSVLASLLSIFSSSGQAAPDLKIEDPAPVFSVKTQDGVDFNLNSRKGQWTVLYFYPKAETPGCTKQACTMRDNIEKIRAQGADVFGISIDTVEAQSAFHKNHKLNFTLLADADGKITNQYGVKMPVMNMAKRWTFILDPNLKIRMIQKDVDPVADSLKTADVIAKLKAS